MKAGLRIRSIVLQIGLGLILAFAPNVSAQIKKPSPAPVAPSFSRSLQAVVVTTENWTATKGRARLFERRSPRSKWKPVGQGIDVVIGRSGLGTTRQDALQMDLTSLLGLQKKEGDGRSPAGIFPLTFAFGKADSIASKLSYQKLGEFTECVDDVNSTFYNRVVDRMHVGIFDWKSSEKMASVVPEYDLGVFVAYNSYPAVKGNGSCIFLHIWKDADTPTSGCTAMARDNLERIVSLLDPKKAPFLIQLPDEQYRVYQKAWRLPKLN